MTTINQLSAVDDVSAGDQVPIYSSSNGDARKASMSTLMGYMQDNLTFTSAKPVSQYSAPSATAFSVTITDGADDDTDVHLILTPTAGFAAGTITLPPVADCVDKQEILVNCTQAVTTLTIAGNGATVTGAPTTLAANAFFKLKFDDPTSTWYRVA